MTYTPAHHISSTGFFSSFRARRGGILVFTAVVMVAIIGVLALVLDAGAASRQRRLAQTATDAAAIGGASEIFLGNDSAAVVSAAYEEAVRNGFPAADVTVTYPPTSAPYSGNNRYVEVVVNREMPTIFGSIFNFASIPIQTRGIAGVSTTSLSCVYVLDPTGSKALEVNGRLEAPNCGITVNSTASDAVDVKNGARIMPLRSASQEVSPPPVTSPPLQLQALPPLPTPCPPSRCPP